MERPPGFRAGAAAISEAGAGLESSVAPRLAGIRGGEAVARAWSVETGGTTAFVGSVFTGGDLAAMDFWGASFEVSGFEGPDGVDFITATTAGDDLAPGGGTVDSLTLVMVDDALTVGFCTGAGFLGVALEAEGCDPDKLVADVELGVGTRDIPCGRGWKRNAPGGMCAPGGRNVKCGACGGCIG